MPLDCLATRWLGEAFVLHQSEAKADLAIWRYESYMFKGALWLLAIISIASVRLWRWRLSLLPPRRLPVSTVSRLIFQPACLIVAATVLGFTCRILTADTWVVHAATPPSPDGPDPMDFLLHTDSAGAVAEKAADVDLNTALEMQSAGALFVDARDATEFAAGHVKGAINCPAADVAHLRLNMAGVPKSRRIAVYCISAHCGKGRYIASALLQQGYPHVVLYNDGWAKWTGPKE